jgi:peptide-methionine (S)-S-oxide reductase
MKIILACLFHLSILTNHQTKAIAMQKEQKSTLQTIVLGAGCFWCVEAVYEQVRGVVKVESGYAGGESINPTYEEVCSGNSNHIEVCKITYDPQYISLHDLLLIFWEIHDPTTPNRQGNDIGTQYQSVIFCNNETELKLAREMKTERNASKKFANPIITNIREMAPFYKAENYHQNYFNSNNSQPYCKFVIQPKLEKFKKTQTQFLKH